MRKKRLLYGERPIGVALRPHLLHHEQFQKLSHAAQRVTSALEKVAAAVVQDPNLMDELGMTEAERKMALVDPGFSTAGVTTRLDAFVRGDEIKFVESNAENPSSLPDQEELNRIALRAARNGELCQTVSFTAVLAGRQTSRNVAEYLSRMGRHRRAEHRDPRLEGPAYIE